MTYIYPVMMNDLHIYPVMMNDLQLHIPGNNE